MRGMPTRVELLDVLYGIVSRDGRGAALFGQDYPLARRAFERMLIGRGFPLVYLEFPLVGAPGLDVFASYGYVPRGARFRDGAGFGRQDLFDWFAGVCDERGSVGVGIEADTSTGSIGAAGVYLQQRGRAELVAPFLASMGEETRYAGYEAMRSRMPDGWADSYVGLFPGREGSPTRIGGYLRSRAMRRCEDPGHLRDCLDAVGFEAYSGELLDLSSRLVALAPSADFQFDLRPDGSLGDVFGLSLSFNEVLPRDAHACMDSGHGARIMGLMEEWGLADSRWRLLADATFAKHVGYLREDGREGRLALCIRFNYAKVKFVAGVPRLGKFYLTCSATVLA